MMLVYFLMSIRNLKLLDKNLLASLESDVMLHQLGLSQDKLAAADGLRFLSSQQSCFMAELYVQASSCTVECLCCSDHHLE